MSPHEVLSFHLFFEILLKAGRFYCFKAYHVSFHQINQGSHAAEVPVAIRFGKPAAHYMFGNTEVADKAARFQLISHLEEVRFVSNK